MVHCVVLKNTAEMQLAIFYSFRLIFGSTAD